jgi:transcription initiation factor IIE alpha subunit
MCPHCGGKIYFDDSVNPEDILCPACQKPLVDDEDLEELDGEDEE